MNTENKGIQPILTKQYHIPYEMFRDAFTAFQKRYVHPRNYMLMAVFLAVACLYGYYVAIGTQQQKPVYCMIVLFCIVMCAFQWFKPRKIRRNLLEAVRGLEEDLYELRLFPEYLEIGTILPEEEVTQEQQEADELFEDVPQENFSGTRIYYSKALKITEHSEYFIVYMVKSNFYILPKKDFTAQETTLLRTEFAKALGKGFAAVGKQSDEVKQ